jgi:hypothetical protein
MTIAFIVDVPDSAAAKFGRTGAAANAAINVSFLAIRILHINLGPQFVDLISDI